MQQPTENSHLPWPWRRLCPCSSWALVGRYCSSNKGTQLELPKCDSLPGYPPDPAGGYRPSLKLTPPPPHPTSLHPPLTCRSSAG
jgi:hypothetical protein